MALIKSALASGAISFTTFEAASVSGAQTITTHEGGLIVVVRSTNTSTYSNATKIGNDATIVMGTDTRYISIYQANSNSVSSSVADIVDAYNLY